MSHEVTITVPYGENWLVFPSIKGKKRFNEDNVVVAWQAGEVEPFGIFSSLAKADYYAKKRSKTGSTAKGIDPEVVKKYNKFLQDNYGFGMDSNTIQLFQQQQARTRANDYSPMKQFRYEDLQDMGLFTPKMPVIEGPTRTQEKRRLRDMNGNPITDEYETGIENPAYSSPFPRTI